MMEPDYSEDEMLAILHCRMKIVAAPGPTNERGQTAVVLGVHADNINRWVYAYPVLLSLN